MIRLEPYPHADDGAVCYACGDESIPSGQLVVVLGIGERHGDETRLCPGCRAELGRLLLEGTR